jgi:hypothetical protein
VAVSSRLEDLGELLSMPHSIRDLRERSRERGDGSTCTADRRARAGGHREGDGVSVGESGGGWRDFPSA